MKVNRNRIICSTFISILGVLGCLILFGCDRNAFEVDTVVEIKFTAVSGRLAVEYTLGDLLILDEWEDLNVAQMLFLIKEGSTKSVHLHVIAGDFNSMSFTYTIGNIEVVTDPVKWTMLMKNVDSFPGVTWKTKDGETIDTETPEKEGEKKVDINKKKL